MGTIATVAGLAATAATTASQLARKSPAARGNVTQLIIAPDAPQPYMMGEGYYAGVLRHDAAYGGEVDKVPNPYRGMVVVYSGGGPIESIAPRVDKAPITSWYSGALFTSTSLGATPQATALSPHFAGLPGWGANSKLSGQAHILWNFKFDKKGKKFASGVPMIGAYGKWVKAYDPRLDSTFPGGSGPHRLGDESTYTWTENPALHFGTYAYGRYQNGARVMGAGLRAIDWGVIAAWANVCDANAWTIFGVIYEPANRWENLIDIAAAGGAIPVVSSGGLLSVKYWAPQIELDTITRHDLAEGQVQYSPLQSWDDRVNTIVPRYISADHEWNQVAANPVTVSSFVSEDGEEKRKEWPYNLVKKAGQAAQLAAYQIFEGREINPIVIPCGPRMRAYRPGECLYINLPEYGLETPAIVMNRTLDPATMTVTLTLMGETPGKHAVALGQTPSPPAIPVPGQSGEDRDETSSGGNSSAPIEVANQAAMLALNDGNLRVGTIVKLTDTGQVYQYNGGTSGTIADWTLIASTASATAAGTSFTPAGNIAATNVQTAIQELDTEKAALSGADFTGNVTTTGRLGSGGASFGGVPFLAGFRTGHQTEVGVASGVGIIQSFDRGDGSGGGTRMPMRVGGSTVELQADGSSVVTVSSGGIDVTGLLRGDSLRLDVTATAAAVAQTHHVPVSINGTTYKLLLAS